MLGNYIPKNKKGNMKKTEYKEQLATIIAVEIIRSLMLKYKISFDDVDTNIGV
jgi:hypothetical protein